MVWAQLGFDSFGLQLGGRGLSQALSFAIVE